MHIPMTLNVNTSFQQMLFLEKAHLTENYLPEKSLLVGMLWKHHKIGKNLNSKSSQAGYQIQKQNLFLINKKGGLILRSKILLQIYFLQFMPFT